MNRFALLLPAALAFTFGNGLHAIAQTMAPSATASAAVAPAQALSEGEIRKVDKDAKKITIRHGEIKNLEMPPMTMVFQVADPAMLETVKAGDKIKFVAEKIGSAYVVTRLQVP